MYWWHLARDAVLHVPLWQRFLLSQLQPEARPEVQYKWINIRGNTRRKSLVSLVWCSYNRFQSYFRSPCQAPAERARRPDSYDCDICVDFRNPSSESCSIQRALRFLLKKIECDPHVLTLLSQLWVMFHTKSSAISILIRTRLKSIWEMSEGYRATRIPATWMPLCLGCLLWVMSLIPCFWRKQRMLLRKRSVVSCGRASSIHFESEHT